MKIIIAPDSFKGTLSASRVADIMADAFVKVFPRADIIKTPLADGGEGTIDCFAKTGAEVVKVETTDGYGNSIEASYCRTDTGIAVLESAQTMGLTLNNRREPDISSSFGLGVCFEDALYRGCKEVVIGLGGTGSNDGGCGFATALGTKFYDRKGNLFTPTGKTLQKIADYDDTHTKTRIKSIKVSALCDVTNPFYGDQGAAPVFAPQKGADTSMVRLLDGGMKSLALLINKKSGIDLQSLPGSGAAGGLGGGIVAFLGGNLVPGIEEILRLIKFDKIAQNADFCVTGEGSTDRQTLMGKTILGLLKKCNDIPLISVSGIALQEAEELYERGLTALCAVNRVQANFEKVKREAEKVLYSECRAVASLIKLGMNIKDVHSK